MAGQPAGGAPPGNLATVCGGLPWRVNLKAPPGNLSTARGGLPGLVNLPGMLLLKGTSQPSVGGCPDPSASGGCSSGEPSSDLSASRGLLLWGMPGSNHLEGPWMSGAIRNPK